MADITTIIFDLGGVLVDWNPEYLFTDRYFESKEKKAYFFNHICTPDWNEEQDAGRSIAEATRELAERFPDWEKPIQDYYGRWTEMLKGPINETVEIFRQLKDTGKYKFYALTNWSAETFPIALQRFDFLHWFDGHVVSGEEKTRKPFPAFYHILLNRYSVRPEEAVFIDDNLRNVKAAEEMGIRSIQYINTVQLQDALRRINLIQNR